MSPEFLTNVISIVQLIMQGLLPLAILLVSACVFTVASFKLRAIEIESDSAERFSPSGYHHTIDFLHRLSTEDAIALSYTVTHDSRLTPEQSARILELASIGTVTQEEATASDSGIWHGCVK